MAGLDRIGTREWTETLKAAYDGEVDAGDGIPLGGEIHDSMIDPRIKPGSRAYLARMEELAAGGSLDFAPGDFLPADFA